MDFRLPPENPLTLVMWSASKWQDLISYLLEREGVLAMIDPYTNDMMEFMSKHLYNMLTLGLHMGKTVDVTGLRRIGKTTVLTRFARERNIPIVVPFMTTYDMYIRRGYDNTHWVGSTSSRLRTINLCVVEELTDIDELLNNGVYVLTGYYTRVGDTRQRDDTIDVRTQSLYKFFNRHLYKLLEEGSRTRELIQMSCFKRIGKTTALVQFAKDHNIPAIVETDSVANNMRFLSGYDKIFSINEIDSKIRSCVIDEYVNAHDITSMGIKVITGYYTEVPRW